jgi:23S rRNA (guanosine2251-2'-O)-methyltransferase
MSRRSGSAGGGDLIYGRQPVREIFRADRRPVHELFVQEGSQDSGELKEVLSRGRQAGISVKLMPRRSLDQMVDGGNHQGVAATAGGYPYLKFDELLSECADPVPFWLVLDHLTDPQNLGSLLRSADAAGVSGVFIPSDRAAGVTGAVVRASAGAAEHMRVCRMPNVAEVLRTLKRDGVQVFGLAAGDSAMPYTSSDMSGPVALVVGNEGKGLARLVRETCDALISLPQLGHVDSLNAAVAGAIVIYEVVRQRSA